MSFRPTSSSSVSEHDGACATPKGRAPRRSAPAAISRAAKPRTASMTHSTSRGSSRPRVSNCSSLSSSPVPHRQRESAWCRGTGSAERWAHGDPGSNRGLRALDRGITQLAAKRLAISAAVNRSTTREQCPLRVAEEVRYRLRPARDHSGMDAAPNERGRRGLSGPSTGRRRRSFGSSDRTHGSHLVALI